MTGPRDLEPEDSTPDPRDQAVTMRAAGWAAVGTVAVVGVFGVTWAAVAAAVVVALAVVLILLADEVTR